MPNRAIYERDGVQGTGVAVTGTGTYYSKSVKVDGQAVGFHLIWTETVASLTGAFTLWKSNKPNPDVATDTDWVQDTAFPAPTVSGTGKGFVEMTASSAERVRLKYVNATGSGTVLCYAKTPDAGSA